MGCLVFPSKIKMSLGDPVKDEEEIENQAIYSLELLRLLREPLIKKLGEIDGGDLQLEVTI
ncbi:hypothetical protein QJS10_CPA10g01099 [Acorus calamus]|uniref:Uncharacterized protein n=1 Tax=Acorus calamus TaxID=4465 RepID=A0AAV9DZK4_ACOCL|nr:hypothetical protein QJS10_CPA10g01099 [Acorus calamus]